ncbi:MAG: hypothetical protein IJ840_09800 [Bacteroidales bacterium]|nr:hypothetical protein [Bacteroidales bacterium]
MKRISSLLMMTATVVVSCQIQEDDPTIENSPKETKEVIITASLDDPGDTRTEHIDYKKVYWLPSDEIVVFSAGETPNSCH